MATARRTQTVARHYGWLHRDGNPTEASTLWMVVMDDDGYPTEEELARIAAWPVEDFLGWMDYIHSLWTLADWGWHVEDGKYLISTAGWSGNEDIIEAMQKNTLLWVLHWQMSRRGGHYEFQMQRAI